MAGEGGRGHDVFLMAEPAPAERPGHRADDWENPKSTTTTFEMVGDSGPHPGVRERADSEGRRSERVAIGSDADRDAIRDAVSTDRDSWNDPWGHRGGDPIF